MNFITKEQYMEKAFSMSHTDKSEEEFKNVSEEELKKIMGDEYIAPEDFDDEGVHRYPDGFEHRLNIRLDTQTDVIKFEECIRGVEGKAILTGTDDEETVRINARSIIGAIYSMTWDKITLITTQDVYFKVKDFVL